MEWVRLATVRTATTARAGSRLKISEGEAMAAYLVGSVKVKDPESFGRYRQEIHALVEKYGGRFLASGGRVKMLEGGSDPDGAVVIEFPSYERLMEWYQSEECKPLIELRQRSADTVLLAVDAP